MSTSGGHLRSIPGGGEGSDVHDGGPSRPFEVWEAIKACDNRDMDVARIFEALKRDRDSSRPDKRLPRALSERLIRDEATASDAAPLFVDVALLDDSYSKHIIWDDRRPRQLHIWPDGHRWGDTPPRSHAGGEPTYTACGQLIHTRFIYGRAHRGEWHEHAEAMRTLAAQRDQPRGPGSGWVVYDDPRIERRICAPCAEYEPHFHDCRDDGRGSLLPAYRLASVLGQAAEELGEKMAGDRPPATLVTAQKQAARLYAREVVKLVARLVDRGGEASLRRMFGHLLRDIGRGGQGPQLITEYDEIAAYTRRLCRRLPHESLDERDWETLLAEFAPGAPSRRMTEGYWPSPTKNRLRASVRDLVEERARDLRRSRSTG